MYNKLSEELCPGEYCPEEMYEKYGTDDCGYSFPVVRNIPEPKTEAELLRLLLGELLKGSTQEEQAQGFKQESPFPKMIKDFKLKDGLSSLN